MSNVFFSSMLFAKIVTFLLLIFFRCGEKSFHYKEDSKVLLETDCKFRYLFWLSNPQSVNITGFIDNSIDYKKDRVI